MVNKDIIKWGIGINKIKMNIYKREGASQSRSIAQAGKKPRKIVGIIKDNIKNDSL